MSRIGLAILAFFILVPSSCHSHKKIPQSKITNTYNILCEKRQAVKKIFFLKKKFLPDFAVFNVLIISEDVGENAPLYKIISQLNIEPVMKKKLLRNITDGILKIYFDLGASQTVWQHNYRTFEDGLGQTGLKILNKPPDFIIISHAHWSNYMGGIEYLQKKYPLLPIFITPDMKEGLVCFDYDEEKNNMKPKPKDGRVVKIENPIILSPGVTVLTERLSIITQKFRHKWPNIALKNGRISTGVLKKGSEYENILIISTKRGIAMFTTCMHSSFLEAVKKAMKLYNGEVYLYCGGFEEDPDAIIEAKKISPSLKFLLYHCAPLKRLISRFGKFFIKRIQLGESIHLFF